ncbi:MAG: hypothetical protein M0R47_16865 [Methylobacter sp.]|uniref:hypothetical protein n=1 Tax=Methylobacter sp. TaxID=2051955 RepID=UPI0026002D17|nr:hypothetical protein [Methylobacter sp.]MCK9622195.1 hypothetical protein [Methylobacter sp.]
MTTFSIIFKDNNNNQHHAEIKAWEFHSTHPSGVSYDAQKAEVQAIDGISALDYFLADQDAYAIMAKTAREAGFNYIFC